MGRLAIPESGLYSAKQLPGVASRRQLIRTPHKVRICRDNRAYVAVPFTIQGTLAVGKYGPEWRSDRDYWIARVIAEVGRHDDATHPLDGTPSGTTIKVQMRRVKADLSSTDAVLASDSRLVIDVNHHQDAINDEEAGAFEENDFNIHRLAEGDRVFVDVLQVGSGRPGTALVTTIVLVPIP